MKWLSNYFVSKVVLCVLLFMGVLMYTFPVQFMFLSGVGSALFGHGINGKLFMMLLSFLMSGTIFLELHQRDATPTSSWKLALFTSLPAIFGGILLLKSYLDLVEISQNIMIASLKEAQIRTMFLFVSALLIAISWTMQAMTFIKLPKGFLAIYFIYGAVLAVIVDVVHILNTINEEFFAYSLTTVYPPLIWSGIFAGLVFLLLQPSKKIKHSKVLV